MTLAEHMLQRWRDDTAPIESVELFAHEIAYQHNGRVRIKGYLYSEYKRFIFSDGSVAVFANSCLTVKGAT